MRELRTLLTLAGPIMLAQVGQMLLTVVDVLMVGRLGVAPLDAAQLGHMWVWGTTVPVLGIVMGMDPLVSQAHGAGDSRASGLALQRALLLSLVLSAPLLVAWWLTEPALVALGQEPMIAGLAGDYVRVQTFSVPMMPAYTALTIYLQGRGIVRPPVIAVLLANVVNTALNPVLIYGWFGLPALGVVGSGLATACTRIALVLGLIAMIVRLRLHAGAWTAPDRHSFALGPLWTQVKLGLPIGLQYSLEMWAFAIGTLIAGRLDPVSLAAHSIVLTLASFAFMVPLGISIGTSARVGNLIGAGQSEQAQHAAWVALRAAAAIALLGASVFVLGRKWLPRLVTSDVAVIECAATILPIAAAFQVFDALQAVGGGVLRGMGKPRPAALFNLVSYFVLALPLAYWLALHTSLGVRGIWFAYALGLALVSCCLIAWIAVRGPGTVRALAAISSP